MLPILFGVSLVLVWLIALAATQVRIVDAARETARAAAREDRAAAADEAGRKVAPPGAHITVTESGTDVVVVVEAHVRGPGGLLAFLPSPTLHAEAVAAKESP